MLLNCFDNLWQEGWVLLLEKIEAHAKALYKEMELARGQLLITLLDPILSEFISCKHLTYKRLPSFLLRAFEYGM